MIVLLLRRQRIEIVMQGTIVTRHCVQHRLSLHWNIRPNLQDSSPDIFSGMRDAGVKTLSPNPKDMVPRNAWEQNNLVQWLGVVNRCSCWTSTSAHATDETPTTTAEFRAPASTAL